MFGDITYIVNLYSDDNIVNVWLIMINIYIYSDDIYIWVNYNDLTATEPWNHSQ